MGRRKKEIDFNVTQIVKTNNCGIGKKISFKNAFVPQDSKSKDEAYRNCITNANKRLVVLYDIAEQSSGLLKAKAHDCINAIYRTDFSGKYSPIKINTRLDNIMKDFYDWWD